jgi:hypothetical protein
LLEVGVVDVFENDGRSARHGILHDRLQRNNIRPSAQVFQNFDFSLNLLLLDRLENLDDAFLVARYVDALNF